MSDQPSLADRQAASFAELLEILRLRHLGTARIEVHGIPGEAASELGQAAAEVYLGSSQPQPHHRTFGGQVLAQALHAASHTVMDTHPGRLPHSMHAYFVRPGDDSRPIRFAVERMRDGGSFSTRRVHAIQRGAPILSMMASYQDPGDGLEHQDERPEVPGPAGLASIADVFGEIDHPRAQHLAQRPVEHRHVEGQIFHLAGAAGGPARQHVWWRTTAPVPDDPYLRAAVLAYASDYTILEAILRRHGVGWAEPRLRAASLDHAMWFHRAADPHEWLLYAEESPSAQGGRGLGTGRIFTVDGTLVATVAQEGMVRLKPG